MISSNEHAPDLNQQHLLIIVSYAFSEPVLRNRISVFIRQFQARGGQVTLICPHDPEYDLYAEFNTCSPRQFNAIEVNTPAVQGVPFLRRALMEWKIAGTLLNAATKHIKALPLKPSVMVSIPSMFLLLRLNILLSAKPAFAAVDVRDLTWEYLGTKRLLSRIAKHIIKREAIHQLKSADLISVTNRREYQYVAKVTGNEANLLEISNGISQLQFENLEKITPRLYSGKLTVLYLGNLGHAQDLTTLLHAARVFPQHRFILVGNGSEFVTLAQLAKSLKLSNLEMPGRCPWEQVREYYQEADVLYTQLTQSYQSAVPSKLYEYLVVGRPVIFAGSGHARAVLEKFKGVYCCASQSVSDMQACLNHLESEIAKGRALSTEAIATNRAVIAKHYIREKSVKSWLGAVCQSLGSK